MFSKHCFRKILSIEAVFVWTGFILVGLFEEKSNGQEKFWGDSMMWGDQIVCVVDLHPDGKQALYLVR